MKRTRLGGWFSVGALVGALAVATVPVREAAAQSQSKADEAKVRYEKGVELHTEGDFQSALIEFKRSYEVVPNYHVLYNIGQVYFQLADYANALRTFQQYLDDGGKRIPVSRRSDVERDVDKLRSRVATITLKLNVPDVEVRVDDQLVQIPDSGVLLVSAGKRKIEVSKPGFKPISRTEEIAGEEKRELKLELVQELTPDDRPIIVPGPAAEEGPPVVPIILWSLTGALAVGTGVTGALALSADSTLDRLKTEQGNSEEQITSQADQATTLALVTDILLAASIVSAGVSTVFTVLELTGGEPEKPAAPSVSLRVGPLGAFVDGRF